MKIGVIGAGGVRSPLLIYGLAEVAERVGLDTVTLYDIDDRRLQLIGRVAGAMGKRCGMRAKVRATSRAEEAVEGASFVISSIRAGGIPARIRDEAIPLSHGLVGQETVGAGGFAFALRNLHPMLEYARLVAKAVPNAVLINFTNPVGILSQGLLNHTDARVLGVCDTPLETFEVIAKALDRNPFELDFDYFGLNHLGWIRAVRDRNGKDLLPDLLRSPDLIRRCYRHELFPPELIQQLGVIPTEYLYFYYFPQRAVENMRKSGKSRGQVIEELNEQLFSKLADAPDSQLVPLYEDYLRERNASYFSIETTAGKGRDDKHELYSQFSGYERIAVLLIEALCSETPRSIPLTVRNGSALPDLRDDDSVEMLCDVSSAGAKPRPCGSAPDSVRALLLRVKEYERMTVEASIKGSYDAALAALEMNPLVGQTSVARAVLDEFIEAFGGMMGIPSSPKVGN